jgi:serine/threonine-protein kinase
MSSVSATPGMDRFDPATAPGAAEAFYQRGDVAGGRYVVCETLGVGPLGVVYRAENRHNHGSVVALRVIYPELLPDDAARGRFIKQAIRARAVQNRYVAPLFEAFIEDVGGQTVCVVAVKHLAGPTLASRVVPRLAHGVPWLAVEAQPIISQIGLGLSAIHGAGLVHGNLNWNNILLAGDQIRIADLGIASALPAGAVAMAEANAGRGEGRAPEVAAGRHGSASSDVYAFAVLTGQVLGLFAGQARHEVESAVPASVRAVLRRALAQNPRDRYADVDTFAAKLIMAFERAGQRSAIGLRAVTATPAGGLPVDDASPPVDADVVAGALDIPLRAGAAPRRAPRPTGAASVVVAPEALDLRTPPTLPPLGKTPAVSGPSAPGAIAAEDAAYGATPLPVMTAPGDGTAAAPAAAAGAAPAARASVGRDRAASRLPLALVLVVMFWGTALAAGVARNVINARIEERVARARVEKAELLRQIAAAAAAPRAEAAAAAAPARP